MFIVIPRNHPNKSTMEFYACHAFQRGSPYAHSALSPQPDPVKHSDLLSVLTGLRHYQAWHRRTQVSAKQVNRRHEKSVPLMVPFAPLLVESTALDASPRPYFAPLFHKLPNRSFRLSAPSSDWYRRLICFDGPES